jgi:choice-of-anchor A domain-containing protein
MNALLLTLSLAISGDPCAQQGDPALPIGLDLSFDEVEIDFKGAVLVETGFPFRFFGQDYNNIWINGNGTLSLCQPVTSKTGALMPSLGRPLLAPFWAAADPQNCEFMSGAGKVWVRHEPNRLVVIWDHVGYEGMSGIGTPQLTNTFEAIITDGSDPLVGIGNNVLFAYGDMGWSGANTTGGTDGFGGVPGFAGIDAGDGLLGGLIGRFRWDNSVFTTPETDSGVHWLNGQSFSFDTRTPDSGDIPTLGAEDFAAWVHDNLNVLRSAISGPVMIGRDGNFDYFTIASDPRVGPERRAVSVRKNLHMAFGNVLNGSVQFGKSGLIENTVGFQNTTLVPLNEEPPNQLFRLDWFENLMEVLAFFAPGGSADFDGDTVYLTGSDPVLNTFSVTAEVLSDADRLLATVPSGSTVALTVHGGALGHHMATSQLSNFGFDLEGVTGTSLLIVMPDICQVTLDQVDFKGSLLAPSANVDAQFIRIYGQVIARTLNLTDATLHGNPMMGCFCLADLELTEDLRFSPDALPVDQPDMEVEVYLDHNSWTGVSLGDLPNSLRIDVRGHEERELNLDRISRVVVHGTTDRTKVWRSPNLPVPVLIKDLDLIPRPDMIIVRPGTTIDFNLLENDSIPSGISTKVRITSPPSLGAFEHLGDGNYSYTPRRGLPIPSEDSIRYRLLREGGPPSHEVEARIFITRS